MSFETDAKRSVYNHYGERTTNGKFGSEVPSDGFIKEVSWDFSYNDLPAGSTNKLFLYVPSGAKPLEAYFQVITAFAGGTSYDIDLVTSAGAAIGAGTDKLWDAVTLAEIDASETVLKSSTHAGTNSGNALEVPLTSNGYLAVAATGTFTAGRGRITLKYLQVPAS